MTAGKPHKVLIHVQHLLGVGHLKRAAALARGLCAAGVETCVASGGMPVPTVDVGAASFVQLPAARAEDTTFTRLVDDTGDPVDENWWRARQAATLSAYEQFAPDALVTEHFPFGRRKFRRELVPLFQRARGRPERPCLIASSVRDVLVDTRDAAKTEEMRQIAEDWFDLVIVHADPSVSRLEETFPPATLFSMPVVYSGYIVEPRNGVPHTGDGNGEIIVSAGGGAVGSRLFETALAARKSGCLAGNRWRFLAGANMAAREVEALQANAPENVIVEPARTDFPSLLKRATLSISQAGYNTMMDLLVAECPAVVVPFAAGSENEQTFRAERFRDRGLLELVHEAELSADTLAAAATRALAPGRNTARSPIDLGGAENAARILIQALENREARDERT